MKREYINKCLHLVVCTLLLLGCESKDHTFNLKGSIEGYTNGMAYLKQFNGNEFSVVDSAEIDQGQFIFSGSLLQPQLCTIEVEGHKYPIRYFFLEAGQLNYTAFLDGHRLTVPTIEGTPTQQEYNHYTTERESIYRQQLALRRVKAKNENEEKENQLQISFLGQQMDEVIKVFIEQQRAPLLSLYLIWEHYCNGSDGVELASKLKPYTDVYAHHPIFKAISSRVEALKRIAPGQLAPTFEMASLAGPTIQLSNLQGKITLLDFWASWCAPCRRENPNMVKLFHEFHDQGLQIIGISLDNDRERWEKAVQADQLTWHHVCDFQKWSCQLVKQYAVRGVPFTVLIDQEGKIIATGLHGETLHEKVREALERVK